MHKILVKFPTRSRPQKFLNLIEKYINLSKSKSTRYQITYDLDDLTMNPSVIEKAQGYGNVKCIGGYSKGKIHACNRDMEKSGKWDIVVLASDDMIPVKENWDQIISDKMKEKFPDLDGVLWFHDGFTPLNTMCIIGRKYFERFNYIYHPDYISLWCDNEFHEVADKLGKHAKFNEVLFKHEHPANIGGHSDQLYQVNEKFYHTDHATFLKRQARNFDL
jgi:hypothetical protein